MPETPSFLVTRLKAEGEKTAASFVSLSPDQWDLPVYAEGETWTVRSLLAHYVTSERALLKLFVDVLGGGPGARADFDVDRYNAGQQKKTSELSPRELLQQFGAVRSETAAFVSGLSQADLEKQGRHPSMGVVTLGEMIKLVYLHNQTHSRDLRHALSG
jgi:hypothetical protein